MITNTDCVPCNQTMPQVTIPAPPECIGEPCSEIFNSTCVVYDGPNIPCFNITTGMTLSQIVLMFATYNCPCVNPTFTLTQSDVDIQVDITSDTAPSTNLYEVQYMVTGQSVWIDYGVEVVGQLLFSIIGLIPNTSYDVHVRKVCDINTQSSWVKLTVITDP